MFKEILPAYNPPSRGTLSGRLLDKEADHLTLEYLIVLKDYSSNSYTGEFLTNEISNIVEKLGSDKFAAIVTDAASNCNLARQKIQQIHSLLVKGFTDMKIKGGGLKVWSESNELVALMQKFESKLLPFGLLYVSGTDIPKIWWRSFKKQSHLPELALRIFSINSTQANCEQNFSMLKWILDNHRTKLTESDLQDAYNISSVSNIMDYNEDQTGANNEILLEDMSNNSITLSIEEIFDLETEENSESFVAKTVQADFFDDLNYDPYDVLNNFLEHENQRS
ncbi:41909_t:CDS:2 [Gigaspora margarita]|uniref:41909_t:CDS:1 n=1 Tax=Gigaspora margarita TaxID=4874 RepID=A0ABN7V4T4_GIGMA|nr:41909_t:CDS:2 [Gigaspora margarita]